MRWTAFFLSVPIAFSFSLFGYEPSLVKEETQSSIFLQKDHGVTIVNLPVPGGEKKLEKKLHPFLRCSWTKENLRALQKTILVYWREHHFPLVTVNIPQQDITQNSLRIVVKESRIGEIIVEGNDHFSSQLFRNSLHLRSGDRIDEESLIRDIDLINKNPFHHADLAYAAGEKSYTTDVKLLIQDRFPFRIYAGYDNAGLKLIQNNRAFTGFNWGNFLGLNQLLSCQFITAVDFKKFAAFTAEYKIPLTWWRHLLTFYGGYSGVHAKLGDAFPGSKSHGHSLQASMRYEIPVFLSAAGCHTAQLGFDYKGTDNTLEYSEESPIYGGRVNLTQLVFAYNLSLDKSSYKTALDFSVFWSPGRWLSDQTDTDYQNFRYQAEVQYAYILAKWTQLICLPRDFTLSLAVSGQASNSNLLQSEMFSVGGANSVRGYEERELNGDNGLQANLEVRTPRLSWNKRRAKEGLQVLAFVDYGYINLFKAYPGEKKADSIIGAGPGIRYVIDHYFCLSLDWGLKLRQGHRFGPSHGKLHCNFVLSY